MSKRMVRLVAVCVALSAVTSVLGAQAPVDEQAVAKEVAAALKEYHRLFSSKKADEMSVKGYAAPLVSLGRNNYTVWSTRKDVENYAQNLVTRLQSEGWDRSDMPSPTICVLTPTSAIASGDFVRYRKDGSVIGRYGNAYVFSKGADGWRVVAMLAHQAGKALKC